MDEGLTEGLLLVEVKPLGLEVQLYVCPLTAAAPMLILLPEHIPVLAICDARGSALMVAVTVFESEQPLTVTTSLYTPESAIVVFVL